MLGSTIFTSAMIGHGIKGTVLFAFISFEDERIDLNAKRRLHLYAEGGATRQIQ